MRTTKEATTMWVCIRCFVSKLNVRLWQHNVYVYVCLYMYMYMCVFVSVLAPLKRSASNTQTHTLHTSDNCLLISYYLTPSSISPSPGLETFKINIVFSLSDVHGVDVTHNPFLLFNFERHDEYFFKGLRFFLFLEICLFLDSPSVAYTPLQY